MWNRNGMCPVDLGEVGLCNPVEVLRVLWQTPSESVLCGRGTKIWLSVCANVTSLTS